MKKSENMPVCLSKMVLAQYFCTGCWDWQKAQQSLTPIVDLARGFDWSSWVAISSLLPFAVPVSILWLRSRKNK
jgi:hypothetical protein